MEPGARIEVSAAGAIRINGEVVDNVRIVSIDDPNLLESVNNSVFRAKGEFVNVVEIESPRIIQGYIESSNVSMIDEMSKLVILSRIYGINAKVISTRDGMLTRALEMGRTTP